MPRLIRAIYILFGIAVVVESVYTPGFQLFSSLVGGGVIGANLHPLFRGE